MISTKIPDKYKYKVDSNGNVSRNISDYGCEIHDLLDRDSHDEDIVCKNLKLIECPRCGQKMLAVDEGIEHTLEKYFFVYCKGCGWSVPSNVIYKDKLSAIDAFIEWLEVFHFIGNDRTYVDTDITRYLMTPEAKERQDYIDGLHTIGELENIKENASAGNPPVASIPFSTIYQLVKLVKPVSELYLSAHPHSSYAFDVEKTFAPLENVLSDAITGYKCSDCNKPLFYTDDKKTHLICCDCNKIFERNEVS
jgi:DNA-directed RNA polymerase subunit RPC12/RpoP